MIHVTSTVTQVGFGSQDAMAQAISPTLVEPSIRMLMYYFAFLPDPVLTFLLQCHAPTLEKLVLPGRSAGSPLLTPLLAGLPNLRKLDCPPLEDMVQLLRCTKLTKLVLDVRREDSVAALTDTALFLRQATQLTSVEVEYFIKFEEGQSAETDLILALAASGESSLQYLNMDLFYFKCKGKEPPQFSSLAAALPGLRQLRGLSINMMRTKLPPRFLTGITPRTAPSLQTLSLRAPAACTHAWIHKQEVQDLLRRNPHLHISMFETWCCKKCEFCVARCHQTPWVEETMFGCMAFFAHPESEQCGWDGHSRELTLQVRV